MAELKELIKQARKYFPETNLSDIDFLKAILQSVIKKGEKQNG